MTKRTEAQHIGTAVPVPPPPLPCLARVTPRCETPRNASGYCEAHQPAKAPYVPAGVATESAVDRGMRREQAYQRERFLRDDVTCQRCAAESVAQFPRTVECDHHAGRRVDYVDGAAFRVRFAGGAA